MKHVQTLNKANLKDSAKARWLRRMSNIMSIQLVRHLAQLQIKNVNKQTNCFAE